MNLQEMQQYEDLQVQSNLDGYYTKRHNLGEIIHNHRKLHINEVVFDIDCNNEGLGLQIMDFISSKLIKDKISHSIWLAKSFHIHSFFQLEKYDLETRKVIRKAIIRYYAEPYVYFIDFGVCSEKRMIRDFYSIHEETGKQNLCVYDYGKGKINQVPKLILDRVLRISNTTSFVSDISSLKLPKEAEKGYADFIAYCLNARFDKDCFRNSVYFKNIAIAVFRLQLDEGLVQKIFKQIALNCKGKKEQELLGWLKWCKCQKHLVKVNWNELKRGGFYMKLA